jgi:PAS domain S-box-containing protein
MVECCENRLRHQDGHWVRLSWTIRASAGHTFCVARDVTAERRERRALRDREQRLSVLLETMAEGVVMHDASGRLLHCNAAAERHFGLTRAELEAGAPEDPGWQSTHEDGAPFPLAEHPQALVRRTGEAQTGVRVFVHHADGRRSTLSIDARPIVLDEEIGRTGAMSVVRDITEESRLRRMADRLARQERFVATGTLAAGVGHEINNPLSYVMGNLDYVLEELDRRSATEVVRWMPECRAILREARDGAERVRKIVRGLRALAQEGGPVRPTSVEAAVRQALDTAAHAKNAILKLKTKQIKFEAIPTL